MLSDRQTAILKKIIQFYTENGAPVGSKTLMSDGNIHASSATIRNDMMRLEELGLIEKTHSSSGRIPSLKGYRFYVDHLIQPDLINSYDVSRIQHSFKRNFQEINELIAASANILSDLTSYTAITLGPEVKNRKLTGFRMVPLNDGQVMAILVTDKGNVENQIFHLPKDVSSQDLEKMIRIVNDQLINLPLPIVYQKLQTELPVILQKYIRTSAEILPLFTDVLQKTAKDKVFVGGKLNLFNYALLENVDQLKTIYEFMDDDVPLTTFMTPISGDMEIRIGEEMDNELFNHLSLITATYQVPDYGTGTVAILGPTSMPYARVISLVNAFRYELTKQLEDYYHSLE